MHIAYIFLILKNSATLKLVLFFKYSLFTMMCQKSDLLTCNGIRWCKDLLFSFLSEQKIISRIPLRKLRLKKAYSNGFMAELKYDIRNVSGVRRALKLDAPL